MQPETAAEVREWLEPAGDDLREAEHDLMASPPLVKGMFAPLQQRGDHSMLGLEAPVDIAALTTRR